MAALQTHPQMHPGATDLQTIFATLRRWLHLPNLVHVRTFHFRAPSFALILPFSANHNGSSSRPHTSFCALSLNHTSTKLARRGEVADDSPSITQPLGNPILLQLPVKRRLTNP